MLCYTELRHAAVVVGIIRKLINAIIRQSNLIGRFCAEQEMIQIFKPYCLEIKDKKIFGNYPEMCHIMEGTA